MMGFRIILCTMLLFLLLPPVTRADVIWQGTLQATSDGIDVTVRWITDDESGVARFEIERRGGTDGDFAAIGGMDPKGPSLYEFVDHSAFLKTGSLYQYRIKITFTDGRAPFYTTPLTVSHTVSGVRRTWGSIKAMFR